MSGERPQHMGPLICGSGRECAGGEAEDGTDGDIVKENTGDPDRPGTCAAPAEVVEGNPENPDGREAKWTPNGVEGFNGEGAHFKGRSMGDVQRGILPGVFHTQAAPSGVCEAGDAVSVLVNSKSQKKTRAQRKKERTELHKTAKRAERRQKQQEAIGSKAKAIALKHIARAREIGIAADANQLRRSQRGYVGVAGKPPDRTGKTLEELVSEGFLYIPWDGM